MNVIYKSEHFWIVSYPALPGYELFDRDGMRMLFLHGAKASHFRRVMEEIPPDERDFEHVDAFLETYCKGESRPIVFH